LAAATVEPGDRNPERARKGSRPVWLREEESEVETPVYDRYALRAGDQLPGPALVEEMDSTTLVPRGYTAEVHPQGCLLLRKD
jgi:N-methylhydantoinase A/oxoprolinase/acetone carboxylase beta subunit